MDQLLIQGEAGGGGGAVDASCYRNRDELWADEPPSSFEDLTYYSHSMKWT